MTEVLSNSEIDRKEVMMRRAVSRFSIPLRAMGLVIALVLLAACAPPATPAPTPTEATPTWDYVVLGDSTARGFPEYYAAHIEADLGVEVTVDNRASIGQTGADLLRHLRDDQWLRDLISEAEVVTFWTDGFRGYDALMYEWAPCDRAVTSFREDLDAILAEILSLRSGSDTIIRTMEFYNPWVNKQKEEGIFEESKACVEAYNEQILQAASEHNIPVARVYLAFNGPNGDEDPSDRGYMRADVHRTNDAGDAVIADLLRELGYEPLGP